MKKGDMIGCREIISDKFVKKDKKGKSRSYLTVKCKCGEIRDIAIAFLNYHKEKMERCRKCAGIEYRKNVKGVRSGKLVAREYVGEKNGKSYQWACDCDCGKVCYLTAGAILSKQRTSCGCRKRASGSQSTQWKGYEEIAHTTWASYQRNARLRDLDFLITIEYAWNIFVKQNKKCSLTGRHINITRLGRTASLDRIDNTKGYIEGNIQWVHKDVNRIKGIFKQDYLIKICCEIADNHRKKNNDESCSL